MKLNILVNGKTGIINLTHSTFIVEDLKAHICKKMGLDANSYKMKIDFSFNHIELIQTKGNPSFSSNQKTNKKKVNIKLIQWNIEDELRKLWESTSLANLNELKEIGSKELKATKGFKCIFQVDSETEYNYTIRISNNSNVEYIVNINGKDIHKTIFNTNKKDSIWSFWEQALPTDRDFKVAKIVAKIGNAWATKINQIETLEEFYSLPLPYKKTTHEFSDKAMTLTVEGEKVELLYMHSTIQFCFFGARMQYINGYENGNRFKNFLTRAREDLAEMKRKIKEHDILIQGGL